MDKSRANFTSEEVEGWFDEENELGLDEEKVLIDPAEKYATSQLRVVRETKDYQLDYLKHALSPGKELIDTSPTYQRRLRWTTKKRSLLIESLLLNIPVPPIFLFEHDYNEYEVIDGRQRLEAIKEFLGNNFALAGLEYWSELNKMRFNDLPIVLQRGLLRRSISAVVLLAETRGIGRDGIDVRRVLFDRLNTGGISLNPQELRNALYSGPLNALLIKLARIDTFTTIWGIPAYKSNEDKEPSDELLKNPLFASLADAEIVLRFFALRDAIKNKRSGSLKRILDRFMEENVKISESVISSYETEYVSLLNRLFELFDGVPFVLPTTNRPSRPLYDALMIALSNSPQLDIKGNKLAIRATLDKELKDPDGYDILVGRGNTMEAVRKRIELAEKILSAW